MSYIVPIPYDFHAELKPFLPQTENRRFRVFVYNQLCFQPQAIDILTRQPELLEGHALLQFEATHIRDFNHVIKLQIL